MCSCHELSVCSGASTPNSHNATLSSPFFFPPISLSSPPLPSLLSLPLLSLPLFPPLPFLPFLLPFPSLRSRLLNPARGPGRAPSEIEFGAF